jgi:two-component system LytT family response regulator
MIRVLIADDEAHALDRLRKLLSKYDFLKIEYEAKNGNEVLECIINKKPDVAFLDINMPGISVLQSLPSLKDAPLVIFQTAHSQYAVEAFNINALDYLLKPISEERLEQTVNKIKNILIENSTTEIKPEAGQIKKITVKDGIKIKIIDIEEIYKITFEDGFSFVYTDEGRFLSDKYLTEFEELLKQNNFFRANRNDLVNLKYVKLIHPMFKGSFSIELKNKDFINLSRRKAKVLRQIIDF